MKAKNSLTLKIDSLSYHGGRGVGRHEGVVYFVPGTVPGDLVEIQVTAEKPRFKEAEVVRVIDPSPHRREAPCPVFGRCGGCAWQNVNYSVQIEQKEKILRDALKRIAKAHDIPWRPFVKAPSEFHYRNRIQVQIQNGRVGFFAKRTRDLVPVDACLIAEDKLNERLRALTEDEKQNGRLELALQTNGVVVLPNTRDPEEALFSQVNTRQNETLIDLLLQEIRGAPDWIVDLYCGSGNLTFPLAHRFPAVTVTAVDLSQRSVEIGRKKTKDERIDWRSGDAAKAMSRFSPPAGEGLVVLDPPRTGASAEMIHTIVNWRPKQILYVSCNPTTFARDAEKLIASGYRFDSVRGIDMFPQTEHVELIAALRAAT